MDSVRSAVRLADSKQPREPETLGLLGEGWTAEEALALAIYCSLEASEGVLLAVNHSGDSDSTGSMTGNLLGAHLGSGGLPKLWLHELEMREEIERLLQDLGRIALSLKIHGEAARAYPGW